MPRRKCRQDHHIVYEVKGPNGGVKQHEFVVPLWNTEHQLIFKIQRYKKVSKGFIAALEYELLRLKWNAEDIT
jgi:hypothetical protein